MPHLGGRPGRVVPVLDSFSRIDHSVLDPLFSTRFHADFLALGCILVSMETGPGYPQDQRRPGAGTGSIALCRQAVEGGTGSHVA